MVAKTTGKPRRKERKNVVEGNAYIRSTFNSTIVSITDPAEAVIVSAPSDQIGSKGSRKSIPFTVQLAAEAAICRTQERGMKKVDVYVRGPGFSRKIAIRSLQVAGLEAGSIQDATPQTHNDYHPPERRRV